jgi:hypothetical protein
MHVHLQRTHLWLSTVNLCLTVLAAVALQSMSLFIVLKHCYPGVSLLLLLLLIITRRVKAKGFGHLPTAKDMSAACGQAHKGASTRGPRHPRKAGPLMPQPHIDTA